MENSEKQKIYSKNFELAIFGISHLKLRDLGYIVYRNLFMITNGVIFSVVGLLFIFGDRRAALFLGIISVFNVLAGLFQDINAWLSLERLQLLTASRVMRLNNDGQTEAVLAEEIVKGDKLKLKIGDQVPVDSLLIEAKSFEINEGLITGESNSLSRNVGAHLLAGSVVTSGAGVVETESVFHESRIARMTEGIKRYSINLSPIQRSINIIVKYAGYLLVLVIIFILARGFFLHISNLQMINNIGAVASILVPAGLVFAATLLFAYGAAHLFRRQVLLQEVNATEKLGHIKNLCMDKTGTLTKNVLTVEKMYITQGITKELAKELMAAYIQGTGDSSQTIEAVKKYLESTDYAGEILEARTFSSWRQYGAVRIKNGNTKSNIFVGSSDVFLPYIEKKEEGEWLKNILETQVRQGKRVLCLMRSSGEKKMPDDLDGTSFSVLAVFVFFNNLREGIQDTINFFQERGVRIRIISGDNPQTVRAVAALAGVKNTDKIITGAELSGWSKKDLNEKAGQFTIFARIVPEQKEKIISALKKDGFTAMVGDGANDALAIKKADLGIAMFDGAPATRQLASVVLMNNSFAALPGGVRLADSVIRNLEIFSGVFLNISLAGFFFFVSVSIFGYAFPLTPLNMALVNYVSIGIPGMLVTYWVIMPTDEKMSSIGTKPFLGRIFPFAIFSGAIQAIGLTTVFLMSLGQPSSSDSNLAVLLAFIVFGFTFFAVSSRVYGFSLTKLQRKQLIFLAVAEFFILLVVIKIQILSDFFNISKMQLSYFRIVEIISIISFFALLQFLGARWFCKEGR